MEKIKVKTVFIDLEGTIVDNNSRNTYRSDPDLNGDFFGGQLRDLLVEKFGFTLAEAMKKVKNATKPCGWYDAFYAVTHSALGISRKELWEKIVAWEKKHVIIYKDAVYMVKKLYQEEFELYMVSNCAKGAVLGQLGGCGLADNPKNSPYFREVYGCYDLGLSKDSSLVYEKIVEKEKVDPKNTVMIGNEVEIDLVSAQKAGIKETVAY